MESGIAQRHNERRCEQVHNVRTSIRISIRLRLCLND
nr:MAG TPA: hypothetical protein [Caudoviricetes sp.]